MIAAVSSNFVYLVSKKFNGSIVSFVLGLAVILNPAMVYKLSSGHIYYLISLPVFLGLIYFVTTKIKKSVWSYLLLGMILAFVGAQIQFFAFAVILLIIYFLFNKDKFSIKYSILSVFVALLINLPWLSNFLTGSNTVSNFASNAASDSFEGAMRAKFLNVILLAFSDATTIKYYFTRPEFAIFGLFSLIAVAVIISKFFQKKPEDKFTMPALWILFVLLSTGFFHSISFFPFSLTNPIFREVGHFAPIYVVFGLLVIAYARIRNKYLIVMLAIYLLLFVSISAYAIVTKLPVTNFKDARENFQEFEQHSSANINSYRVLTYPFFGQYSFNSQTKEDVRGRLIENSGIDGFSEYSDNETISNYIQPQDFDQSVQYRLLKSYDIRELKEKNVKYIYDFSSIWESNFERYAGSEVYDNDLSIIENDPDFFNKLIEKNPNQIVEVEDNIFEITNAKDRIYGENVTFEKISPVKYKINISNLKESTDLTFLESFHSGWKLCQHDTQCFLFDESHREAFEYANQWTVDSDYIKNNLDKDHYSTNEDGSIDVDLILYFKPQTYQNIGIVLAILTLIGSAGYLIVLKLKR